MRKNIISLVISAVSGIIFGYILAHIAISLLDKFVL